jgi:hypothetical protein
MLVPHALPTCHSGTISPAHISHRYHKPRPLFNQLIISPAHYDVMVPQVSFFSKHFQILIRSARELRADCDGSEGIGFLYPERGPHTLPTPRP